MPGGKLPFLPSWKETTMHARGFLALGRLVDPKQLLQVLHSLLSLLFDLIYFLEMVQIQKIIHFEGNLCLDLWGFYPHESDCQQ